MLLPLSSRGEGPQLQRQLLMAGKLVSCGGVNAIHPGTLVFLQDHSIGVHFLAESGAAVSMIPGPTSTTSNTSISLTAANGAAVAFGEEM